MNWKRLLLTEIPRGGDGSNSDGGLSAETTGGWGGYDNSAAMGVVGGYADNTAGYASADNAGSALGDTGYGSFGLGGVTGQVGTAPASMDVSNAVGNLGIGDISMGGFGLGGITGTGPDTEGFGAGTSTGFGTSLSDPSGVAAGMLGSFNMSQAFGVVSPQVGLTTAVPGYAMSQYSGMMAAPSPMSIGLGMVDAYGNVTATNAAMMGPAGQVAMGMQEAIGMGTPGMMAGNPGIAGASMAYGATTSPSATTTASAPSAIGTTSVAAAPATTPTVETPSLLTDPLGYFGAEFSQALGRPVETVANMAVSFVPGLGLVNTASGLFGGPTVGGGLQSLADAIASGDFSGFGNPDGFSNPDGVMGGGDGGSGGTSPYNRYAITPNGGGPLSGTTPVSGTSSGGGIASVAPIGYDLSRYLPSNGGLTQTSPSPYIGYRGLNSVAMNPNFGLGSLSGTYSYTPS